MTARPLTATQRRALEWLPADGAWRPHAGPMASALWTLILLEMHAECRWVTAGDCYEYRLTPAGTALKAELEAGREPATATRNTNSQGGGDE